MKLRKLIQRIRSKFAPRQPLSNEAVVQCLRVLEDVRREELTCSKIYSQLDEYVECEIGCKDAAHLMPLIREHLDICPECCDYYETLLEVVEKMEEEQNLETDA